jgi:hypothetical protein
VEKLGRPRKARKGGFGRERWTLEGAKPYRVTLWLAEEEKRWIRDVARRELPMTPRKQPRAGILVTELVRFAREELAKREG